MATTPNMHSVKRAQLAQLSAEIDTLIMGSSNAYFGIVPADITGSTYNLAITAESLYYTDRQLENQVPKLPKLQRVVIVVGYISLYFQFRRDEWEGSNQYYWQREWGIEPQSPEERDDIRMWSRVAMTDWHLLVEAVRRRWDSRGTGLPLTFFPGMNERGWQTRRIGPADTSARAAEVALGRHHAIMHEANFSENRRILDHMLAFLREHHIKTTLLVMPVWDSYAAGIDQARWQRSDRVYRELCDQYGAQYLNFMRTPRIPESDFFDTDHLNPAGAARFTKMLNTRLPSLTSNSKPERN